MRPHLYSFYNKILHILLFLKGVQGRKPPWPPRVTSYSFTFYSWDETRLLIFSVMQQPNRVPDRLTVEVSWPHTHTHKTRRTHISSGPPLSQWSARRRGRYLHITRQTLQTNIHAFRGIRTGDPAAAELRLRPHGHRDRQTKIWRTIIFTCWYTCVRNLVPHPRGINRPRALKIIFGPNLDEKEGELRKLHYY
jgi:hypothetical protein